MRMPPLACWHLYKCLIILYFIMTSLTTLSTTLLVWASSTTALLFIPLLAPPFWGSLLWLIS